MGAVTPNQLPFCGDRFATGEEGVLKSRSGALSFEHFSCHRTSFGEKLRRGLDSLTFCQFRHDGFYGNNGSPRPRAVSERCRGVDFVDVDAFVQ